MVLSQGMLPSGSTRALSGAPCCLHTDTSKSRALSLCKARVPIEYNVLMIPFSGRYSLPGDVLSFPPC